MSIKKISVLCVMMLLAGMIGVADAASPQGVRLRIEHPATGTWAGIGDSVVAKVEFLPGTAALDSVVIAIVEDTTSTTIATMLTSLTNDSGNQYVAEFDDGDAKAADADGFKSYTATFLVTAGQTVESSGKTLSLSAFVSSDGGSSFKHLTNQNTEDAIDGVSSFAKVGDQVKVGIDAQRPSAAIDSVRLDTTGISDFPNDGGGYTSNGKNRSGDPKKAFKVGSKVKVSFFVTGVPSGATGIVHIADTSHVTMLPDSAMGTVNFAFSKLVSGSATDSTSVTLTEGKVGSTTIVGDSRRVVAVAFLSDAAGNLSSSNASDVTPVGVTDINMHVLDVNSPTITPANPKSGATDSTYFTGVVDTTIGIVAKGSGTLTNTTFAASPLEFKTDEGVSSATATFGDSTLTLSNAATVLVTGNSFKSKFATDFGVSKQAGSSGTLKITVKDSSGNSTSSSQASVTYDQVAPGIKTGTLFPTRAAVPTDAANSNAPTVNRSTMMPILQLLEAADSLSAQYVEDTAGTPVSAKQELASGDPLLATTASEITITFADSIHSNRDYTLQIYMRDLAGNHQATTPDTLTYDADFKNPVADSFVVAANGGKDVVIAGTALILDVTGIDTALTNAAKANRAAVTHATGARIRLSAGDQDVSNVTFGGTGVTANSDGSAALSSDGWTLGTRQVTLTSTSVLGPFSVIVEDLNADSTDVDFNGSVDSLQVDASNFSSYNVTVVADADGGDSATGVSGQFKVQVVPADQYGNTSSKTYAQATGVPSRADSLALIDTAVDSSLVLGEVFVTFSSNNADVAVPQGPQAVNSAGSAFTIGGASTSGSDLTVSVRTVAAGADTVGAAATAGTDDDLATGSTGALTFAPEGEEAAPPAGTLASPANILVQDYRGSDGTGDQGAFVLVSYPVGAGAKSYRIYREVSVSSGLDADGKVVAQDAANAWVSWAVVSPVPDATVQRHVVPTLDNASTRWAVASEAGGGTASPTASSKRVFTKMIVQNMVQYLGVDPNRVMSMTELEQVFTPSADYVKSILGDRTDIRLATIEPDLATLLGGTSTVPTNIRTKSGGIQTSAKTISETAVAAIDNIPPAAVESAEGAVADGVVTLTWTASTDDKVVGYSSYKGYSIPIAGVDRYEVYRQGSDGEFQLLDSVPGGVTTFTDSDISGLSSVIYRVDAADLDNLVEGPQASVSVGGRVAYSNDAGSVFIVTAEDQASTPLTVDFEDFIAFAASFNLSDGDAGFVAQADTDDSGDVGFPDFLNFAASFNQTATVRNGQPIAATKPVIRTQRPGANDGVGLTLNLTSDKVLVGQTVTLNVAVDNAASLQGFGFDLAYDTDKFEFVEALPAEEDLLKSGGAETPVFLHQENTPGELTVANAVVDGSPVTGAGDVVSLTFRVLTEFEDNARFEIANGVVFDGSQLSNPVVALGSLNVESTPTEFALLQNFPNPFNPETTIRYNVAEGSNVSLRIYNVVGQVVSTLVAEQQNAGRYTVRWNGTDDRGVSVSSGIYFYQISASDFSDVKKLMLLK